MRALRFLLVAYAPDLAQTDAPVVPSDGGSSIKELVRVSERLLSVEPGDDALRRGLVAIYLQAGRQKDADALAKADAAWAKPAESAPRCPNVSPASPLEETIRALARSGHSEEALARAKQLAAGAGGRKPAVSEWLLAARLYLDLGKFELADETLTRAERAARSALEQRQVALLRASQLTLAGKHREAKALFVKWQTSEDPCLKSEATAGLGMLATLRPAGTPEAAP
jgi:hypothetical protein